MARPLLADPFFVAKAAGGRADEINTCIACNQACLDHAFTNAKASCLVNPRAGRETSLVLLPLPTPRSRRVAVVGAGPAGLAAAVSAAERDFAVTLFEAAPEIGGQFRLAMAVPGKEEFAETLRYYARRLEVLDVDVRLSTRPTVEELSAYDEVVVATGVVPRIPDIEGLDHRTVATYAEVLAGAVGAWSSRGRHRRRRASVSTCRSSSPTSRSRSTSGSPTGASLVDARVRRSTRAGSPSPSHAPPRARSPWSSARRPRSASASARPRAGRTGPC